MNGNDLACEYPPASILVVDDHRPNLAAMEAVLAPLHVDVVYAESGAEALGHLLHREFALVLLDVMMPELDGFEIASMIRQRRRTASTPIIFVTANSLSHADVMKAYSVGAADYLMKPFDTGILLAKVRVFIELHEARNEIRRQASALSAERVAKERAAAYRFIAENIPQQVWTASPSGALDYVNPVMQSYFEEDSDTLLGLGWLRMLHPDDVAPCMERWTASLTTGVPFDAEARFRRHDGEYRWHLSRARPERDADGNVVRWFGTNTDIEEAKALESSLRAAVQSRDDLLATVSHDLRAPLSTIVLATQMLDRADLETARKHQEAIARAAGRMEQLIRDLLDMASIESGHLSIEPEPIVTADLLSEAVESVQPAAGAKHIQVATSLAVPGALLHADRGRLLQVFSNILGNAIKFSPAGGKVSIQLDVDDAHASFAIADSGPGIRSEELPFVFDRFWQARETSKAGTGLGLAICKGIVQRHGGSIWVESKPGRGTTFHFTMPLARET